MPLPSAPGRPRPRTAATHTAARVALAAPFLVVLTGSAGVLPEGTGAVLATVGGLVGLALFPALLSVRSTRDAAEPGGEAGSGPARRSGRAGG